jgi:hypothetical protein
MNACDVRIPAVMALVLTLAACGEKKPQDAAAPQPPPAAAPAPAPVPAPEAKPAPAPAPPPEAKPAPAPKPDAAPPAAKPAPAPPPATKPPPAASAHAKVGADKCKACHRVQHQSWATSPHAAKGLDCEGCHGNGGDYWPAAVMRDRAKAAAAGLVTPTLASCRKCHGAKTDAALFEKVHAHKPK